MKYETIVLSGGGIKGFAQLGALHYYWEHGAIDGSEKYYAGSSIGSMICMLLASGYSPIQIFTEFLKVDNFLSIGDGTNIKDAFLNRGAMNMKTEVLENLLFKAFKKIPTFRELYSITGKFLVVTGANLSLMRTEYFTPLTFPDMSIIDAVKISCSVPFVFRKVKMQGSSYVDGGLGDNFPIRYVDDGKRKLLGVVTIGSDISFSEENIMGFLYRLSVFSTRENTNILRSLANPTNSDIIYIEVENLPMFDLASGGTRIKLFNTGYEEAKLYNSRELLKVIGWSFNPTLLYEEKEDWDW